MCPSCLSRLSPSTVLQCHAGTQRVTGSFGFPAFTKLAMSGGDLAVLQGEQKVPGGTMDARWLPRPFPQGALRRAPAPGSCSEPSPGEAPLSSRTGREKLVGEVGSLRLRGMAVPMRRGRGSPGAWPWGWPMTEGASLLWARAWCFALRGGARGGTSISSALPAAALNPDGGRKCECPWGIGT